jgi:acyl carrier protein
MEDDIELKIKQAICQVTKVPEKDISIDSLLGDVGVDSFAGIDLVYTLEDTFNIKISDNEMRRIKSVRDVVEIVKSRLKT